jgi:ElaB/YqjD/DUF883 family membrane-anchored ribosome-binding protein
MATIADNPFPSTTGHRPDQAHASSDMGRDLSSGLGSPATGSAASSMGSTPGTDIGSSAGSTPGTYGGSTSGSPGSPSSAQRSGNDLLGTVVQGAHSAIDRLAEAAAPAVHKLQDSMSSTGGALSERAGHVREMGDEWAESLRVTVRENPLAAVATAVAVGILISKLTQR